MFTTTIDVSKFAELINVNVATVVRAAATELWGKVILRSPVDTGYFRRNWQISVDVAAEGTIGHPPLKGPDTLPPPPMPEIPQGALHVFLLNNVAYAESLENGRSKQAPGPGGIVAISVAEVEAGMEGLELDV